MATYQAALQHRVRYVINTDISKLECDLVISDIRKQGLNILIMLDEKKEKGEL